MRNNNHLLTIALLLSILSSSTARLGRGGGRGERRVLEPEHFEDTLAAAHEDAFDICNGEVNCILEYITNVVEGNDNDSSPTSGPTSGPTSAPIEQEEEEGDFDPITILQDAGGVPNLDLFDATGGDLPNIPDLGPAESPEPPVIPQDAGGDLPNIPDLGLPDLAFMDAPQDGQQPDNVPILGGGSSLPDLPDLNILQDMGNLQDGSDALLPPSDILILGSNGDSVLPDVLPDLSTSNNASPNPDPIADAGTQGDPHFKTWKNEHFEYHGQCDLVLVKDAQFANGLGLDVQIRTKVVRYWSFIKSAAIRIGTDLLEIQGNAGLQDEEDLRYWINLEFQGSASTMGGFPILFSTPKGEGKRKQSILIDLSSKYPGTMIELQVWREFVKVNFVHPTANAFGNSVGMLGNYHTGQTVARDGVTVLDDFLALGEEWQVLPSDDMLFHSTEEPQFPAKCIEPEEIQGLRRRRLEEASVTEEQAEEACASLKDELDRKDCIYDILATQDLDMAGAY